MSELPEVKRYSETVDSGEPTMVVDEYGDYVEYADYESLRQRLEESEAKHASDRAHDDAVYFGMCEAAARTIGERDVALAEIDNQARAYGLLSVRLEAADKGVAYMALLKPYFKALNKMSKGGTTDDYIEARDNLEAFYKRKVAAIAAEGAGEKL